MSVAPKIEEAGFTPAPAYRCHRRLKILQIGARAGAMKKQGLPDHHFWRRRAGFRHARQCEGRRQGGTDCGDTKYTALDGTPELKKAIAEKVSPREQCRLLALDEVTVATGAKQILFNAFMATVNPGDEVIIPTPYWTSYSDIVEICGGVQRRC